MGTAYPEAPGFRDIGASTMRYLPEIYSGKIQIKFYDRTVLAAVSNTDHEGEIKQQGDTVYIRSTPDITIRPHTKGQTLEHEQPESAPVTMLIDQGLYWAFGTSKVDDVQTDIKRYTDNWTGDAAQQMKIETDTIVLAAVYSDAAIANQGATAGAKSASINLGVSTAPVALTKSDILDKLVDCGTVLDEQSVPEDGRFVVLPPWACGLIKKSDLKDASLAGDGTSIMRNGRLGMIDRFVVYNSNLLDTTLDTVTVTNMIFGTTHGVSFASQLVQTDILPNPYAFGTLFRGLQVFGYKVVKPEALGWLYAYKG